MPVVRYVYYAFIFSIPFEEVLVDAGIGTSSFSAPRMVGYLLVVAASLQPALSFRRPPKAVWYLLTYLLVIIFLGVLLESEQYRRAVIGQFLKFGQMLILFWISHNMMRYERVVKGTLMTLAASTTVLAVLQIVGVTSRVIAQDRIAAAGGANPNTISAVLALGLLALLGLAYSRRETDRKVHWLTWFGFGILVIAIVHTGSRGPVVALAAGLLIFLLKGRSLISKLKTGLIVLLALGSLVWASYQVEGVRARWEQTLVEGSLAKREKIFPRAWAMFKEKPLIGWGPISSLYELRDRMPLDPEKMLLPLDTHNLYLTILTATGLLGAVPFFATLWLCGRAAWRARDSLQGVLPMAMLACLLTINMAATWHNRKLFWVVLAYALASSSYVALPRLLKPVKRQYRLVRH
jgi:O-antigen ligase